MNEQPNCPVCAGKDWRTIGSQTYRKTDSGLNAYTRKRYEILFDLWAVGKDTFTATYQLCDGCGLGVYTPRPTSDEVSAKYADLGGASSSTVTSPVVVPIDTVRSDEIYGHVSDFAKAGGTVLDFGGGTGSLMCEFVRRGYACSVVDYAPEAIPGVERAAKTIDELNPSRRFDLIVASHVIEHVPEPLETVRSLAGVLSEGGYLYVEVPFELLGAAPSRRDPVTHINFFAESSLAVLVAKAGLDTKRVWTAPTIHAQGHQGLSVCLIAQRNGPLDARPIDPNAAAAARRWVEISAVGKAAFLLRHPGLMLNPVKRFAAKRRAR